MSNKTIRRLLLAVLVLALPIVLLAGSACGGGDDQGTAVATAGAEDTPNAAAVLTVSKGSQSKSYTLAQLKAIPATEGWGGLMHSSGEINGPYKEKGVALADLLAAVGGIGESDGIRISAKDGYSMTMSYKQAAQGDFTTLDSKSGKEVPHDKLTVIIAYEENGAPVPENIGPLRLSILSAENQVTEGHWWIKWIDKIEVVAPEKPFSLKVEGVSVTDVDSSSYESCTAPGCHLAKWADEQGSEWEGVPLWLLLGYADDADESGHKQAFFNDALADKGYEVHVLGADGYCLKLKSADVKRNDNIILAWKCDGEPLAAEYWPLRLVGSFLGDQQRVGQVTKVKLALP